MHHLLRMLVPLVFILSPLLTGAAVAQAKPHIVIFIADDHGQLDSTPYGATDVRTPKMQRLARAGMTFSHAFAASPSCAPSRASILTGLMPNRHGAMVNHARPKDEVRKWPAYLRMLGYLCAAFGKVAHYGQDKLYGFDHYQRVHDAKTVAAFLETHDAKKPLCLFVGTHSPHVPWPEKATYDPDKLKVLASHVDTKETRALRARYYTAVSKADDDFGDIIDVVRAKLGENVLFICTSDHGAQWPFGKWNLYDAGIRVPFLAAWPGVIRPASHADAMISLTDLLPTMIEVAGGKAPADLDGKSFADVLRGKKTSHRDRIFATHSRDGDMNVYPIRAVRTRDWAYIRNLDPKATHTTHIDKAMNADGLIYWSSWVEKAKSDPAAARIVERYAKRPAEELYDLKNDPLQLRNVATDPANGDRLTQLRAQLDAWMIQQADEGLKTEKEQVIPGKAGAK
jgi:N-sulfoglucosamine sulfohydrolase